MKIVLRKMSKILRATRNVLEVKRKALNMMSNSPRTRVRVLMTTKLPMGANVPRTEKVPMRVKVPIRQKTIKRLPTTVKNVLMMSKTPTTGNTQMMTTMMMMMKAIRQNPKHVIGIKNPRFQFLQVSRTSFNTLIITWFTLSKFP
jgi:hypothetical protein